MRCGHCGSTMPDDSRYCMECGSPISEDAKQERERYKRRRELVVIAVIGVVLFGFFGGVAGYSLYLKDCTYTSADGLYSVEGVSKYNSPGTGTVNGEHERMSLEFMSRSNNRLTIECNTPSSNSSSSSPCRIQLVIPSELYKEGRIIQMNDSLEGVKISSDIGGESVYVIWTDWEICFEEIHSVFGYGTARFHFEFSYGGQFYVIDGFGAYNTQ